MTIDGKNHTQRHVVATVGQATRRDASGVIPEPRYESYTEELDWLKSEVIRIESQLVAYSKGNFTKEQMRIRNEGGDSLRRWLERKVEMTEEREQLVRRKQQLVERIVQIKPRVNQEFLSDKDQKKADRDSKPSRLEALMEQLVTEVQAIKFAITKEQA